MSAIIELVISMVDLLEAELSQIRTFSRNLFLGFGLVLLAAALGFIGFCLLLGALFYWLFVAGLSIGWAAVISGCLALGLAGAAVWISRRALAR
ncbi:MAG: hypothetical protein K9K64_17285 [Desulfohalobiaceae bacterium]|nr:hypothetical protein [Desulfohalobiaceae bacterium]